jgi:hypothetical protein
VPHVKGTSLSAIRSKGALMSLIGKAGVGEFAGSYTDIQQKAFIISARFFMRGKAEDEGGLTPAEDDNGALRKKGPSRMKYFYGISVLSHSDKKKEQVVPVLLWRLHRRPRRSYMHFLIQFFFNIFTLKYKDGQ